MARKLLLWLAIFLAIQAIANLVKYCFEISDGGHFGSDFLVMWQAAGQVITGKLSAIYRSGVEFVPGHAPNMSAPFAYPPHALFLFWPFGFLPYEKAVALWSALPAAGCLLLAFRLLRRQGSQAGTSTPPILIAALMLPFLLPNIFTGQTGAVMGVFFLGAALAWKRAPVVAGICMGLMTIKPQFVLLLPFVLLAARQWKTAVAAFLTAASLMLAATFWLGAPIWNDYLAMTRLFGDYIAQGSERFNQLSLSPYVSLHGIGLNQYLSAAVQVLVTCGLAIATFLLFRKEDSRDDLRFGMLACFVLLSTPYALCYDAPLLAAALLPLSLRLWRDNDHATPEMFALVLLTLMPYAEPGLYPYHAPFGLLTLLFVPGVLFSIYLREEATRGAIRPAPGIPLR